MAPSSPPDQDKLYLKKGDLLFKEGDTSRAMYLLETGTIRLFTFRGNAPIEIGTIRAGQIIGELAFLDANPRSLSAEALCDCELSVISTSIFSDTLDHVPDWLKILFKTVIARLRTANTRIRQLEASHAPISYSEKNGAKRTHYIYITHVEFLKVASALLISAVQSESRTSDQEVELDLNRIHRYAHFIMGVPMAKITSVIDILLQAELIMVMEKKKESSTLFLTRLPLLEAVIDFIFQDHQRDPEKKHRISDRALLLMRIIYDYITTHISPDSIPADPNGFITLDLSAIRDARPEIYRNEEIAELSRLGFLPEPKINEALEMTTVINPSHFERCFRSAQIARDLRNLNEQKGNLPRGSR